MRRIAEEEWPGTTVGRRTVIVEEGKSFSAVMKEKELVRSSRVEPSENHNPNSSQSDTTKRSKVGDGKGGSFSVGYMPCSTRGSSMPASNSRYPELVRAAFLLERALMPERPPSSTIAVNRNAQFRPHTDSGAGAGQSKVRQSEERNDSSISPTTDHQQPSARRFAPRPALRFARRSR